MNMVELMERRASLESRAAVHRALADPHRIGLVDELLTSDRSPRALAEALGLSSNLLAHHLDSLESAGVIDRVVSTGDRRRRYVRLRRDTLATIGWRVSAPDRRVMFVCTENAARSQLAAALWRRHTGATAASAGIDPAEHVRPGAIDAGRRAGLDLSNCVPTAVCDELGNCQVITVCDVAFESLSASSAMEPTDLWHWSVPDPAERDDPPAYDAAIEELDRRIRVLSESPRTQEVPTS